MSFLQRERSVADGQPVRLYEFSRGVKRWTWCGADRDITLLGSVYRAAAISDDGVRLTGETTADVLTITAPGRLEVAQLFRGAPPAAEVAVTVRDYHFGDPDEAASVRMVWVGSIQGVRWPQPDRAEIACQSLSASMERPGLRLTWERTCPHTIYDRRCGVDRNAHAVATTVQAMDGAAISNGALAAYPDGVFAGGFVEWQVGGGELDRRGIEGHSGSSLVLLGGTQGLALGMPCTVYPGCRQTAEYCSTQFGNLLNFGGFRHLPSKSPFDGDPVF